MRKHTRGPWRACQPSSNFQKGKLFIRPVSSEALIATVSGEQRFVEMSANADLLAAAPVLLDALYLAEEALTKPGISVAIALAVIRSAIEKATGA